MLYGGHIMCFIAYAFIITVILLMIDFRLKTTI